MPVYSKERTNPLTIEVNASGGSDIRLLGHANYGFTYEQAKWNYASSIPLNIIGNYRHSIVYPALLHAIAIIDCEFGSGANPENKYIYQTDRLAAYLAGYNGAQYAIGMSDSWWPLIGILDHAGASIMKGVQEKRKGELIYDDEGSWQGYLMGFLFGAAGELSVKVPEIRIPRLLLAVFSGIIPVFIDWKKREIFRRMSSGGSFPFRMPDLTDDDTYVDEAKDHVFPPRRPKRPKPGPKPTKFDPTVYPAPGPELAVVLFKPQAKDYIELRYSRPPLSHNYKEEQRIKKVLKGISLVAFDNMLLEYIRRGYDKEVFRSLQTDRGLYLESLLDRIGPRLTKLTVNLQTTKNNADMANQLLVMRAEDAFFYYSTTNKSYWYPKVYRELHARFVMIGNVHTWARFFKNFLKHGLDIDKYDLPEWLDYVKKSFLELFLLQKPNRGVQMYSEEIANVFNRRIYWAEVGGYLTVHQALRLERILVTNSIYVKNFKTYYGATRIENADPSSIYNTPSPGPAP